MTAYEYLQNKYSFLSDDVLKFRHHDSIGEGSTIDTPSGDIARVFIGVGDIFDNTDLNKKFDNNDVMNVIVGMFHEVCGHCNQILGQFQQDDLLSNTLAANHYACLASYEYYFGVTCKNNDIFSNYYHQSKEIAAQYAGIKQAHKFLERCFGEEKASLYICDYVNTRIDDGDKFIDRSEYGYNNVADILSAFDEKFINNLYKHRSYRYDADNSSYVRHYMSDLSVLDNLNNGKTCLTINAIDRLENCKNCVIQDLRFAYLYFRENNLLQYASKNIPAFRDISDDKVVFSDKFKPKWTTRPLISTNKNRPKLENLIDLGNEDAAINISKSDWRDYEL